MTKSLSSETRAVERGADGVRPRRIDARGDDDPSLFEPDDGPVPPGGEPPGQTARPPFSIIPDELVSGGKLTPGEVRVYLALHHFAYRHGMVTRVSNATLGRYLRGPGEDGSREGLNPDHVGRFLRSLERKGVIRRDDDPTPSNFTGRLIRVFYRPGPVGPDRVDPPARCAGPPRRDAPAPPGAMRRPPPARCAGPPRRDAPDKEDSGEEREKSTFNVGVSPGGEGRGTDPSTHETRATLPAGDPPVIAAGPEMQAAKRMLREVGNRGWTLAPRSDGDIRFVPDRGMVQSPTEDLIPDLKRLKPQLVALLTAPAVAAGPARGPAGDRPRAAPKASPDARSGVLRMIGQLGTQLGPGACRDLPGAMAALFGDDRRGEARHRESLGTYAGIARSAHDGGDPTLSVGLIIEAVEEACRPGKENRGATFIAAIRRKKSERHGHRRGALAAGLSPPASPS